MEPMVPNGARTFSWMRIDHTPSSSQVKLKDLVQKLL
jgi:hypothetical protein